MQNDQFERGFNMFQMMKERTLNMLEETEQQLKDGEDPQHINGFLCLGEQLDKRGLPQGVQCAMFHMSIGGLAHILAALAVHEFKEEEEFEYFLDTLRKLRSGEIESTAFTDKEINNGKYH